MMAYSEDHIALAAEYALGTLDAGERTEVETMMSADKDFAALVEAWERKLGVLNQMVGSVEPSPDLWEKIRAAAGLSNSGLSTSGVAASGLAEFRAADPQSPPQAAAVAASPAVAADRSNVVDFSRQVRRWRWIASGASALAAALVALVAVQIVDPNLLPASIRPKAPPQRVVVVPAPPQPAPAQYVAVLQKDGSSPAFILSVDPATKNFTVRKVGATAEPGKSFELWLVSDKLQRPRSLGVIGNRDFTSRPALASYDTDTVNKATYAVTVEPEGGSPNGAPTGAIVFSGKLIETVPSPAAPAPPPR
jgi:anti-sigma-K factor RskA